MTLKMSKLSQLKHDWNYDTDVPRCATCVHFKTAMIVLTTNSRTKRINHHCGIGFFRVAQNSVCDKWLGADGSTLEPTQAETNTQKIKAGDTEAAQCLNCGKLFKNKAAAKQHWDAAHAKPTKGK